ncbi:MAG: HAMP domain-containing sensor histidine kinase [Candidatus Sericytochromatia bacterium]|nr:HAMP domain-containing sensor histidine kinase [Candidatus Sericytochromatia bacterium]
MSETYWLVPALVSDSLALLVVTGLSALVLSRFPKPFFRAWVIGQAWRCGAVLLGAAVAAWPGSAVGRLLVVACMAAGSLAVAEAGLAYRGVPLSPAWRLAGWGGLTATAGVLTFAGLGPDALVFLPGFVGYAASSALLVWAFWPTVLTSGVLGGRIVAVGAVVWVLEAVVYPYVIHSHLHWVAPMQVSSALLTVTIGMGMIILLLEQSLGRERRLTLESREQTQELVRTLDALARSQTEAAHHTTVAREQSALVRQIVHDLRNATQALQLIAEEIESITRSSPPVQALLAALDRQLTFISTFLSEKLVWIANRQPGHPGGTAIGPVFESLASTFEPILATRGQVLEVTAPEGPWRLRVSGVELDQILGNLVRNAHQHTPPATHIRMWAAVSDGWVTFYVADTGPGLTLEAQAAIGRSEPRVDGTGVGLSNVFALVTQAGGAFGVVSEPGAGATFHVRLPLTAWGEGETQAAGPASPEALLAGEAR